MNTQNTEINTLIEDKINSFLQNTLSSSEDIKKRWNSLSRFQKSDIESALYKIWFKAYTDCPYEGFKKELDESILQTFKDYLESQILFPCFDSVFKMIFLDDEDYILLKDLIEWVIFEGKRKITFLRVDYNEIKKDGYKEKTFVVDLYIIIDHSDQCNIEVQISNSPGLPSRMVGQATKLHSSQFKKGHKFDGKNTTPTITTHSLWILCFDYTKNKEHFYSNACLRYGHEPHDVMSSDIQLHFLEFHKLPKLIKNKKSFNNNGLVDWSQFFNIKTDDDTKELKKRSPIMERAISKLEHISHSEGSRAEFLSFSLKEMGLNIQYSIEKFFAKEEGRAEGKEEGKEEGRKEGKEEGRKEGRAEAAYGFCKIKGFKPQNTMSKEEFIKIVGLLSLIDAIKVSEFAEDKANSFEEVLQMIEMLKKP